MPNVFVIGGCNGAGKTTASLAILPQIVNCQEFVNADAIAAGLSPLNPDSMAVTAGRMMLDRIKLLRRSGVDFTFESTLAARSFAPFLRDCQAEGYTVNLLYFWLRSPELAVRRVAMRVASGGHAIPEVTIRRRYDRGQKNLVELYLPLANAWMIFDNSCITPDVMSEKDQLAQQNRITQGVKAAVAQALDRHRRLGKSVVVMQGDVIVTLKPEEIPPMPVAVVPLNVSKLTQ
jgi:predicted ABC-type ATPase